MMNEDSIKIAVRLDDITPDMDWQRFLAFKALLDRYQVKPLIGIVPDNRDENLKGSQDMAPADFWSYIRELEQEGWSIALHGCCHTYTTKCSGMFPLNHFSEFAGVPYEEQKSMLEKGKNILAEHGIFTDIFMAPAHSYDRNTLKALKETGFCRMTDGFGNMPYMWGNMIFYPISFKLGNTLHEKSGKKGKYSTMVVHTGTLKEEEYARYEEYFQLKNIEWISYKEYLKQEPVKRSICGRYKEYFMANAKCFLVKARSKKQK